MKDKQKIIDKTNDIKKFMEKEPNKKRKRRDD